MVAALKTIEPSMYPIGHDSQGNPLYVGVLIIRANMKVYPKQLRIMWSTPNEAMQHAKFVISTIIAKTLRD